MTTTWQRLLDQHAGPAMAALLEERRQHVVYPELKDVYRAFDLTPFERVRVVVLGQDCYFGAAACPVCRGGWTGDLPCAQCGDTGTIPQATGLAFSVPRGVPVPPSLRNIYRELDRSAPTCDRLKPGWGTCLSPTCYRCGGTGNVWKWRTPDHGDLTVWAERGVLLINSALSCRAGQPGSHAELWRQPITAMLQALWNERAGLVWLVWGKTAARLFRDVTDFDPDSPYAVASTRVRILAAPHPADRRKGIVGSNVFVECNRWIEARGEPEIDWRLP